LESLTIPELRFTTFSFDTKSKGLVSVSVDGKLNLKGIVIKPELVAKNDAKAVEKSVTEAVNQALTQGKNIAAEKLSKVTGGLNIPGLT
jgi:DNA-binding YbaB/EbfC family protein